MKSSGPVLVAESAKGRVEQPFDDGEALLLAIARLSDPDAKFPTEEWTWFVEVGD